MIAKYCYKILIASVLVLGLNSYAIPQDKQVVGWVENVTIYPGNFKIKAKLDTGAKHSSLNAANIQEIQRNGESWVRFDVTNWKGRSQSFEQKVIRTAKIKEHKGKSQKRAVTRIDICLGNVFKEVEVNLTDRSMFNYQVLIGRSFLRDSFIIDTSKTYTVEPDCKER